MDTTTARLLLESHTALHTQTQQMQKTNEAQEGLRGTTASIGRFSSVQERAWNEKNLYIITTHMPYRSDSSEYSDYYLNS